MDIAMRRKVDSGTTPRLRCFESVRIMRLQTVTAHLDAYLLAPGFLCQPLLFSCH